MHMYKYIYSRCAHKFYSENTLILGKTTLIVFLSVFVLSYGFYFYIYIYLEHKIQISINKVIFFALHHLLKTIALCKIGIWSNAYNIQEFYQSVNNKLTFSLFLTLPLWNKIYGNIGKYNAIYEIIHFYVYGWTMFGYILIRIYKIYSNEGKKALHFYILYSTYV